MVVRNPTKNRRGETPGRREREKVGTPVTVRYHQLFRVRYLEGNEVRAVFVPPLSVGSRGGRGSLDKISMNISQRTSLPARKYNTTPSSRVEGASHDRVASLPSSSNPVPSKRAHTGSPIVEFHLRFP